MALMLREPVRLLDSESTDEFTLRLLRSADCDQPAPRAVNRAAVRVAAWLAGNSNLVITARVGEAASHNRIRSVRPEALRLTRAAVTSLLLGTSLAAAVVGARHIATQRKEHTIAAPVASIAPAAPQSLAKRRVAPKIAPHEEAAPSSAPNVESTPSASLPRDAKPAKSSSNDLGQELALLDAAKAALSAYNPGDALRALDDATRLPRRALVPEATVLRVRALVALNRHAEARRLVETFVARAPNSPVAPVLLDLVAPFEKP